MTDKTDSPMPTSRQKQAHICAAAIATMIVVMAVAIVTDYLMLLLVIMLVTLPVVCVGLLTTAFMSDRGVSNMGSAAWGFTMSVLFAALIAAMHFGASHYSAFN